MGKNKLSVLHIALGINALALIIVGLLLGKIFAYFSANIPMTILYILKAAFIISGLANIYLIFYAQKKLS